MRISWNILSKYKAEIYGFSILWIMLFHGLEMKYMAIDNKIAFISKFIAHGNCGVDVFLFLSGIYLFFSVSKDANIHHFYIKRALKIFLPFFLIDGLFWLYQCIWIRKDVLDFISNMTFYSFWNGSSVKTVWFIALLVPLYILYPFIYKGIRRSMNYPVICIVYIFSIIIFSYACCYLISLNDYSYFKSIEIAMTRIPVFLLGCYCGKLTFEKKEIPSIILLLTLMILLWGLYYFYFHPFSLVKAYRIPYFFIGPSIAIWGCIIFDIINNKYINKILSFLGGISLELYLSHVIFRILTINLNLYNSTNFVSNYHRYLIAVVVVSIGISFIVSKLCNYIAHKICLKYSI